MANSSSESVFTPPLNVALSCFHLTLKHGHTNLLSTALIFEFIHYPYPSASITQPITAPRPQPHTHTGSDTLTHTNTKTQIHFTAGE